MDTNEKNSDNFCLFLNHIKKVNKDTITFCDVCHDFKNFLNGIILNTGHIDYIGFYDKNTKNVYFYVQGREPHKFCSIIYNAWQLFHNNDNINVKIYETYCGQYEERNDYETDRKYLYKYLINMLVDKLYDE